MEPIIRLIALHQVKPNLDHFVGGHLLIINIGFLCKVYYLLPHWKSAIKIT
jgi:hypothetical protein